MIDYKNTLNLPKTKFPMRANLSIYEPIALKCWFKDRLYERVRCAKRDKKLFLLHDGPPYANGKIHLGHAVNKILKDFIIKFKSLMGYDAPYVPGWDCHGLPIELQIEKFFKVSKRDISSKDFRIICRKYVSDQIKVQKNDFMRLGVIGDWENPYLTMNFKTEANIMRTLSKIISEGYLYKGVKPVHWCFQCSSVLAESEVEYKNNHCSTSVYVSFLAVDSNQVLKKFNVFSYKKSVKLIVWTTTLWTLPGNQAIGLNPCYNYKLIDVGTCLNYYLIIAADLVDSFMKRMGYVSWKVLGETVGNSLEFLRFFHPFMSFDVPIVISDHVSLTTGTGIVHIVPAHGVDDYLIAKRYNLKVINLVDNNGKYVQNILPILDNLKIFQVNEIILDLLKKSNNLFSFEKYYHSYPYCWRHNIPLVFRSTSQWFLNMDHKNLRNKILDEINKVVWIPKKNKINIFTMVKNRPDWCISRQRFWGVPMPLFIHKKTKILHPETVNIIERVAKIVEKKGIQAWWDLKPEDIIGSDSLQYKKVFDTLDIWFDSGSTHYSVVPTRSEFFKQLPDIYLEGLDQCRGWFMSSLIISIIVREKSPYKEVLSHSFTVDSAGRKMSKSVGNVVDPQNIIGDFGADILRLWVSSLDYTKEMIFSNKILKNISEIYRKIRNTIRFFLANIYDFDPIKHNICSENMVILDRWAISRALSTQIKIISSYNNYNFHDVVQCIVQFCSIDMGSFYLDIVKDRLYTLKKSSNERRSCQTALYHIIEAMVRWISPIISFTADEIWKFIPGFRNKYVFTEEWYNGLFSINSNEFINNNYWNIFLSVKNEINKVIEKKRESGVIKGTLEADITLYVSPRLANYLKVLGNELRFGLLTSEAKVISDPNLNVMKKNDEINISLELKVVLKKALGKKCPRCWHYQLNYKKDDNENKRLTEICMRCIENTVGTGEVRKFF